jgi:predicted Fe-Mo cluster-binding NifX family protein
LELLRVAIATKDFKGLEDEISDELARSPTITIIDIDLEKKSYRLVDIFENEASRFSHGAGPILVYILLKKDVDVIVGPDIGMGAKELIEGSKIKYYKSKPGTKVGEIINELMAHASK